MGNYRPFLQGPLPVANYTRIIIPGRFWTRPPSTKSTRMASSATPLHDSLIELAIPDAHAHAIKWYLNKDTQVASLQLHVFSDASENAYTAVVYLRITDIFGGTQVSLVSSKTKIAPIMKLAIHDWNCVELIFLLNYSSTFRMYLT